MSCLKTARNDAVGRPSQLSPVDPSFNFEGVAPRWARDPTNLGTYWPSPDRTARHPDHHAVHPCVGQ